MFDIRLLAFFSFFLLVVSNPIHPGVLQDDLFFSNLNPAEQFALTETILDIRTKVANQRSSGSFIPQIDLLIPALINKRIQETMDAQFTDALVKWIGHQLNLSKEAVTELQLKGSGCSSRMCLSIKSHSSDICCPFG